MKLSTVRKFVTLQYLCTNAWKSNVMKKVQKTLEKSGLEPAAPIRLADRKHCALSIQPNPHLQNKWFIGEF